MAETKNTVDLAIDLDTDVSASLDIYGTLTEKARARLIAIIQALPVTVPPPPPPEPARPARAEEEYTMRPVQKR